MKVAITCQNRKSVSSHAGKCTYFLLFDTAVSMDEAAAVVALPPGEMMHARPLAEGHPLMAADALISGGIGDGMKRRWQQLSKRTYVSTELDPALALQAALQAWQNESE